MADEGFDGDHGAEGGGLLYAFFCSFSGFLFFERDFRDFRICISVFRIAVGVFLFVGVLGMCVCVMGVRWIGVVWLGMIGVSLVDGLESGSQPICLLHMHDGVHFFQEYGSIALANKLRYAERHGYEMAVHTPQRTWGLLEEVDCDVEGAERRHDGNCYGPLSQNYENDRRAATFGKIKLAQHACVGRKVTRSASELG